MPFKQLGLSIVLLAVHSSLPAQTAETPESAPPWVVESENSLNIDLEVSADAVRKLLPKGVEPLLNGNGAAGATLEMYETKRLSGIPDHKAVFIFVDVQGHDSRGGAPGRFAVWGRISPQEALEAFRSNFGFPFEFDASINLVAEQDGLAGSVGVPGKEALRVKLTPVLDQPLEGQGSFNVVGMNVDSGTVKSEVPWIGSGHAGKVLMLQVRPGGDPVLRLIRSAVPLRAEVSDDRIFSYSHAVFSD